MANKQKKGWHLKDNGPPRQGIGSATVDPLMKKGYLTAITKLLEDKPRDLALFVLGINTGLRAGDLLRLKWEQVLDQDDHIVRILEVFETKNKKTRRIALGRKPRTALGKWLKKVGVDNIDYDDYLFPSRKGGRMSIQRLHQLVNEWTKKTKIEGHFGTHTLRKTFGYWHYDKGVDIALLMDIFGHSSERITLRYIGVQQKKIDEANLRLNLG